jgi:DNA-binding transcriptional regulator GbsR (MarR family)
MIDLTPVQQKFILHWGEMGTRWGINRTVAQIHALLYIWPKPLNAEEIKLTLSVARSNVSNSLRELSGWGLLRTIQKLGDRKDHYATLDDPWEMFRIVGNERKRREMDPTAAMLAECLDEVKKSRKVDSHTERRISDMKDFFDDTMGCFDKLNALPTGTLRKLTKMTDKVLKLLPF